MAKTVYDVTASEMDFIRLCERLGTEECIMTDAQDPEGMTKMELDLRLSLFREGFKRACDEMFSRSVISNTAMKMNDGDFAAGYSCGSTIAEQAMENYRQMLIGGGK